MTILSIGRNKIESKELMDISAEMNDLGTQRNYCLVSRKIQGRNSVMKFVRKGKNS